MKNISLILESYPDIIQAKIEQRERLQRKNIPSSINGQVHELVFEDLKLWRVGKLSVSFKGGDPALHQQIANTASIWTQYGNIDFDFGYEAATNSYRLWQPGDQSHIRIGFEFSGYWSLVGTDSTDINIVSPGDITLNLNDFDIGLPSNWQGIVLHEFGHALGFHHEHQSPSTVCDFDWELVYEYLAGPPNYWPKSKVDHNLGQLQSGGLTFSAHDAKSIMHYSFPAWMFIKKEESSCFTPENNQLSEMDQKMMGEAYPFDDRLIAATDQRRIRNLDQILSHIDDKTSAQKQIHRHLNYYQGKAKLH